MGKVSVACRSSYLLVLVQPMCKPWSRSYNHTHRARVYCVMIDYMLNAWSQVIHFCTINNYVDLSGLNQKGDNSNFSNRLTLHLDHFSFTPLLLSTLKCFHWKLVFCPDVYFFSTSANLKCMVWQCEAVYEVNGEYSLMGMAVWNHGSYFRSMGLSLLMELWPY